MDNFVFWAESLELIITMLTFLIAVDSHVLSHLLIVYLFIEKSFFLWSKLKFNKFQTSFREDLNIILLI